MNVHAVLRLSYTNKATVCLSVHRVLRRSLHYALWSQYHWSTEQCTWKLRM